MIDVEQYLKVKWDALTAFSSKTAVKEKLWNDLIYRYTEVHRTYHNVNHIAYLFNLMDSYIQQINNPAVVAFAIFYHDYVFDTHRKDNVEQSAIIAGNHLSELQLKKELIKKVQEFILATQNHHLVSQNIVDQDMAFFIDFDLAILGEDDDTYIMYSKMVRQEFNHYPQPLYEQGRVEALQRLLDSKYIYHSNDFRIVMEEAARQNIQKEINSYL